MSIERRFDDFNHMTRMDRRAFLAGLIACASAAAVPGLATLRDQSELITETLTQEHMLFFRVNLNKDNDKMPFWIRQVTQHET